MCNCKNIEMGSYDNSVLLGKPDWSTKEISVDKCISEEIKTLWELGIQTAGCCCGHNKVEPMINVIPEHHNKMIELNYRYWTNQFNVICYKPKSIIMKKSKINTSHLAVQLLMSPVLYIVAILKIIVTIPLAIIGFCNYVLEDMLK